MNITRKRLLQLAGASLTAGAGFFFPGLPTLAAQRTEPAGAAGHAPGAIRLEGADPSFASGEVVETTSSGVVLKSPAGVRAVRFGPGTRVWKEFVLPATVIKVGDWLDVKGTPLADGSLQARNEWIWVNIGRFNGTLVAASAGSVTIQHFKGTDVVELSSLVEVVRAADGRPIAGGVRSLAHGTQIGGVGLRLPGRGFRATRLWA